MVSEEITQPRTYYLVFVALIGLTLLTVSASFIEMQSHITVGLAFGAAKALLVVLFFMHLLHSQRMTWLVAGAGLFWLAIMLMLTLSDYLTRGWLAY
jgi:cytochrome c oxidase subunit 4